MPEEGSSTARPLDRDEEFMLEALGLARRIPDRPWPNPPVGALVVRDGEVVGRGAHAGAGQPHAEVVALAAAGERAGGATLYCTLEPCNHHGRTPPCSEAILAAGIGRVVHAVADPNRSATGGAARLRDAGVAVRGGVLAAEALELIWPYVCSDQFERPYIELKTATSLDGRFGPAGATGGSPAYLTGEAARRDVHDRRRWVDLVLVGHGTARQDRPRLDTRLASEPPLGPSAPPLAGVVARDGGHDAPLDRDHWLVFHADTGPVHLAVDATGVPCHTLPGGAVDPRDLVGAITARGLHAIMLEGGPRLAAAFLALGLVDRWIQYVAPCVVGEGPIWPDWTAAGDADGWSLTRVDRIGRDVRMIWDRRDFASTLAILAAAGGR
ncbi:bifunctional diaminohydroxyphosphoribosylaminopyrimidine deaminase/5-amino-6-(5-phosphoribosylamino)uracil reductase RibD [bacterium]|nr:bifunctional diaminohydroxyphosphoribosylaminopyrimidine deaminase/5-amino-6-(5-phosphoribosylamino)uracil reductase RibD [bacterium]